MTLIAGKRGLWNYEIKEIEKLMPRHSAGSPLRRAKLDFAPKIKGTTNFIKIKQVVFVNDFIPARGWSAFGGNFY